VAVSGDTPVALSGQVRAATDGWSVALDAQADKIGTDRVLGLWPADVTPRTRQWLVDNIATGNLHDAQIAFRAAPKVDPNFALSLEFSGAQVRFMPTLPPIENARGALSIVGKRMALSLNGGHVNAPTGGRIDMAGSTMVVRELQQRWICRWGVGYRLMTAFGPRRQIYEMSDLARLFRNKP